MIIVAMTGKNRPELQKEISNNVNVLGKICQTIRMVKH